MRDLIDNKQAQPFDGRIVDDSDSLVGRERLAVEPPPPSPGTEPVPPEGVPASEVPNQNPRVTTSPQAGEPATPRSGPAAVVPASKTGYGSGVAPGATVTAAGFHPGSGSPEEKPTTPPQPSPRQEGSAG